MNPDENGNVPCPMRFCDGLIYVMNKTTGDQVECPRCETRLRVQHNGDRTTTLEPARRFQQPDQW